MAIQFSAAVANALLDQIETTIGASAILKIRSGAAPANCAAADSGTVLATLNLPADWMAAASGGSKAKSGTWEETSADAAGTVATLETETPARGGWVPIESERSRKHRERRARREREAEQELRRLLRKAYRKAQGIEDERAELVVVAAKEAASAPLPEVAGRIEGLAGDLAQVADLHNAVGLMHEIMRLRRLVAEIDAATIAANDDDEEDAMLLIALAA